jgi:hypothetical protein
MGSSALANNDATIHKPTKRSKAEIFFLIVNIILLALNTVMAFGIIGFYYGLYDAKPYQKAILIAWVIIILSIVVIKEFKVKSLGKRVLLNFALYMAMVGNPYFYFFIW